MEKARPMSKGLRLADRPQTPLFPCFELLPGPCKAYRPWDLYSHFLVQVLQKVGWLSGDVRQGMAAEVWAPPKAFRRGAGADGESQSATPYGKQRNVIRNCGSVPGKWLFNDDLHDEAFSSLPSLRTAIPISRLK